MESIVPPLEIKQNSVTVSENVADMTLHKFPGQNL